MAKFDLFLPKLMAHEGAYVDHPADPGRETYAGIARAYNPQWRGWPVVDAAKHTLGLHSPVPPSQYAQLNKLLATKAELKPLIYSFYKSLYWDVLHLDRVTTQLLAEQLCDHGANAGTARPPKMIQFAVNQVDPAQHLLVDGQLGPKTLVAINGVDQAKLLAAFVQLRRDFYEYRTNTRVPAPPVLALLRSLNLRPDGTQKVFLNSWLARLPKLPPTHA